MSGVTKLMVVNDIARGDRITVSGYVRGTPFRAPTPAEADRGGVIAASVKAARIMISSSGDQSAVSIPRGQSQYVEIEGERPVLLITVAPSEPNLGLATTAQLIDELRARAEVNGTINYRSVGGEG
jgi:hypothetical protein